VKKGLGSLGNEKHYDLPWRDYEVSAACEEAGLEVIERRYHNLLPLKRIHNQLLPPDKKNAFMRLWVELEDLVNDDPKLREKAKHYFVDIYLHVRRKHTLPMPDSLNTAMPANSVAR
jgi:hypothetical protein